MSWAEWTFLIVNVTVLPFWLLMIVLPNWRVTRRVLESPLVLVPLPALYVFLVLPRLPEVLPLLLNPKLEGIAGLLGKPEAALIGWIHFLAFDLFVGRWIYLDSQQRGSGAWLTAPVLLLTFLLGPCGLLVYLAGPAWFPPRASSAAAVQPHDGTPPRQA